MSAPLFPADVTFLQRFLKSVHLYDGAIDGVWGTHTDRAVEVFDQESAAIARELGTFDPRSERHIASLHPRAQRLARQFLRHVREAGIEARIISGTRTYEEQNALFRQGRYGNPGPRVTNARGGRSNHNFGIAWDIGIFDGGAYLPDSPLYDRAAEVGLVEGLEWGGHWTTFPDRPHYQLATGRSLADVRHRFEHGQAYA